MNRLGYADEYGETIEDVRESEDFDRRRRNLSGLSINDLREYLSDKTELKDFLFSEITFQNEEEKEAISKLSAAGLLSEIDFDVTTVKDFLIGHIIDNNLDVD